MPWCFLCSCVWFCRRKIFSKILKQSFGLRNIIFTFPLLPSLKLDHEAKFSCHRESKTSKNQVTKRVMRMLLHCALEPWKVWSFIVKASLLREQCLPSCKIYCAITMWHVMSLEFAWVIYFHVTIVLKMRKLMLRERLIQVVWGHSAKKWSSQDLGLGMWLWAPSSSLCSLSHMLGIVLRAGNTAENKTV